MLISSSANNAVIARQASTHYLRWIEQLPPEHQLKQELYEFSPLYELENSLNMGTKAIFDTCEEIVKCEFGEYDITELGALEAYLSREFDKVKSEYLLIDAETSKTLEQIKLKRGETTLLKLYRNGEELSFQYTPSENIWMQNNELDLSSIISLGFVKSYVQNPEIAKIVENQITADSKGKTQLMLIYGTQLLECNIIVN